MKNAEGRAIIMDRTRVLRALGLASGQNGLLVASDIYSLLNGYDLSNILDVSIPYESGAH